MGDKTEIIEDGQPSTGLYVSNWFYCPYCMTTLVNVKDGEDVTCPYCKSTFQIRIANGQVDNEPGK